MVNLPLVMGVNLCVQRGQVVSLSSAGQSVAKHDEAEGGDDAVAWGEIIALIGAIGLLLASKGKIKSAALAKAAPLVKKALTLAKTSGQKAVSAVKKIFKKQLPPSDAANSATHEVYKKELRRQMSKPYVKDPKLEEIMKDVYRPNAKVGSGSTADAIRHELATGESVGNKFHTQKGKDTLNRLENWINANKDNPNTRPSDYDAAVNVFLDIADSLK